MGRKIRNTLPVIPRQLKPRVPQQRILEENDLKAKQEYTYQYDRRHGARDLPELRPHDPVRIKLDHEKSWTNKGVVVQQDGTPRSYIVDTGNGVYRRNRKHLLSTPNAAAPPAVAETQPAVEPAPVQAQTPPPGGTGVRPEEDLQTPQLAPGRARRETKLPQRFRDYVLE